MAGEVDPQSDVSLMGGRARTLHLKALRKQWQIITLQIVSTIALVWMYLEVVSTYVVNSIDHTMLFASLEPFVGEVPIGDWLIGSGRTGLARFYVPIASCSATDQTWIHHHAHGSPRWTPHLDLDSFHALLLGHSSSI